ncbi:arginase family protein [Candidatus Pacearchaeota archaeon]|nr:arginase family protein [Candidatus Pacearchaeota archaeon]
MFIVKVPCINGLGKTLGCENAGNELLKVLRTIHTNEGGKIIDVDKLDLEEIHVDNSNLEEANKLIYKNAFEAFEEKPRVVFLGGDHSISYSLTRAFFDSVQNKGKEPCLIVFDAHPDCMKPMKEPTHEEWLSKLIEDGFPPKNVLIVGLRNSWKEELNFIKEKGIRTISLNRFENNYQDTCDTIMEFALGKELYVSIDIDVVDPAFAPATGYPVSGGLSSRQLIYLIQRINKIKTLKAVDIVEINPDKDEGGKTVNLGAKILSELI